MMQKFIKIFLITLAIVVGLSLAKNNIVQSIFTGVLSNVAHVPVKVGGMNVGFMSSSIKIRDLKVYNPSGYPDKLMLDIPSIFIAFVPAELFNGKAHFKEVDLDLKELTVVRNKEGRLNVDAVKPTQVQQERAEQKDKARKEGTRRTKLLIDKLKLSIGRVVYKDYSRGGEPSIQTFNIDIRDKEFTNIEDPSVVVSVIMFEALTRTTLAGLADLDLHAFKEGGMTALSKSLGALGNSSEAVQSTAKKLLNLFN